MYALNLSNRLNSLDVFYCKISGLLQNSIGIFGILIFPKLVQWYKAVWIMGITKYDNIPCFGVKVMHA